MTIDRKKMAGYLCVIACASISGLLPLCAKVYFNNGGNIMNILFFRSLFVIPVMLAFQKRTKIKGIRITTKAHIAIGVMSILRFLVSVLLFWSYSYITTGTALTLHYLYPIVVILICVAIFSEKMKAITLLSVFMCIFGVMLTCDNIGFENFEGVALALASALVYSIYLVMSEKSCVTAVESNRFTIYIFIYTGIISLIMSLATSNFSMQISPAGWIAVCVSALLSYTCVWLMKNSIEVVGSQNAAVLSVFEPIVTIFVGVVAMEETVTLKTLGGFVLILVAVVLTLLFGSRRKGKAPATGQL